MGKPQHKGIESDASNTQLHAFRMSVNMDVSLSADMLVLVFVFNLFGITLLWKSEMGVLFP